MPNPVWILYLPSIISSLYYTNTQRTLSGKINSLSPPPRRYRHAQTNKRRRSPFLCPEPNNRIILNYNKWAQSERQTNSSIYRIALIVDFRDYYTPEVDAIWFLRVASHSWRAAFHVMAVHSIKEPREQHCGRMGFPGDFPRPAPPSTSGKPIDRTMRS